MTLDRKDYKSAIPQLESMLQQLEKVGRELTNKFEDIAHQTQLQAAEAEKKVAAIDYQIGSVTVVTEYQLCADGFDPVETGWSTTMPSITYQSYNGKKLWARSVTYQNDVAIRKTAPQKVELMDGLYTFVNSASGNTGWTMIDGDFIQTGKIASTNGYSYFDIDNNAFQMKDASTAALSNSVLAWQNGLLYVKGKIAVGSSSTDQKYYTEMTGDGFDVVLNDETVAHFGAITRVGVETGPHFSLSADKFKFYFHSESLDPSPIGISQTSRGPILYNIDPDGEGSVIRRDGVYWEGLSDDRVNCLNWRGLTLKSPTNWERGIYDETLDEWILYAEGTGEGGDQNYVRIPRVYKKTTTSAANVYVATGNDTQGRLFRSTASSKRYKTDIEDIENADALYDVPVRQFKYRDDYLTDKDDIRFGKTVPGFIAEEVEKVYPIAVEYADGKVEDWAARYIIPPMLKLIQEQKKQIDELAERVGKLEKPNV